MRNLIVLVLCLILSSSTFAQHDANNKKLDRMINEGIKDWQIPGLAVVVVKDGDIAFIKTYGVKNIETKEPVDEHTLFSMASTTKAIIAIALGVLVDQGKIYWDDNVKDHLPEFQLSDPYITADARVKDLLTHNLGIGRSNLIGVYDSTSTAVVLDNYKHAISTYPLRGGFAYQNIMYAIAGELIEAVSGQPWAAFVEDNIFNPLKMNRTQAASINITEVGNYATPYINETDVGLVEGEYSLRGQINARAGGEIWSSISDISNYLKFLVNDGIFNGDTLLQYSTFTYLFKPHAIISQELYPTQQLVKPNWMTYGLGWFQQDYRGLKLDFHTGSIAGLIAIIGVMHEHDIVVYAFANLDHAELRHAIMYKAIDLYVFDDDTRDWHKEVFRLYEDRKNASIENNKKREEARILGTTPSLALEEYAGTYENEMLGTIYISVVEGQLQMDINHYLTYQTEHWHYDTFITNKDPISRLKRLISFNLSQSGKTNELIAFGERFITK